MLPIGRAATAERGGNVAASGRFAPAPPTHPPTPFPGGPLVAPGRLERAGSAARRGAYHCAAGAGGARRAGPDAGGAAGFVAGLRAAEDEGAGGGGGAGRCPPAPAARRLAGRRAQEGAQGHRQGVLRPADRGGGCGPRCHRALRQDGAQDGGELHGIGHRRERIWLQGQQVSPCDQGLHDPGRRLHPWRWHWRKKYLRGPLPRRELQAEALWPWLGEHGQRRQGHQRFPVLHHHSEDTVAGRQARGVWQSAGGHGRGEEGGEHEDRQPGQAPEGRRHRRLRHHRGGEAVRHRQRVTAPSRPRGAARGSRWHRAAGRGLPHSPAVPLPVIPGQGSSSRAALPPLHPAASRPARKQDGAPAPLPVTFVRSTCTNKCDQCGFFLKSCLSSPLSGVQAT